MIKERKPNRLPGYNYSQDNLYFVTSCVLYKICCFGEITGPDRNLSEKQMILNQYGQIAQQQWYWLPEQYPYVVLHAFVVMPNHIHGIIEINRGITVGTGRDLSLRRDLPLQSVITKIKSLSELMGAYKTTVSKQIHLLGYDEFNWQRSFHDHIIRNDVSYNNITNYINSNPLKWEEDTLHNNGK